MPRDEYESTSTHHCIYWAGECLCEHEEEEPESAGTPIQTTLSAIRESGDWDLFGAIGAGQ